jgi:HAD superfamily hydrolase (TIGR01549 family)
MKLVSFDLFDTLISRTYLKPSDLFVHLSEIVFVDFGIKEFYKTRTIEESKLRSTKETEITLDEIYTSIANKLSIEDGTINKIKLLELKLEYDSIVINHHYLNEFNNSLLSKCIITDTYLPKWFIEQIVSDKLLISNIPIFISSELGFSKFNSKIFYHVKNYFSINFNEWTHFGDNFFSDYQVPRKLGICAIHLKNLNLDFNSSLLKVTNSDESFLMGLIKNHINNSDLSPFIEYYLRVCVPIQLKIASEINNLLDVKSINKVFFLSRDGKLFHDTYTELYGKESSEYLLASRKALILPSAIEESTLNIDFIFEKIKFSSINNFISSLSLEKHPEVIFFFNELEIDFNIKLTSHLKEKIILKIKNSKAFIDKLFYVANKRRNIYIKYLKNIGFFDKNKVMIFDLGWHGNMQTYLERISKSVRDNFIIEGYYFDYLSSDRGIDKFIDSRNTFSYIYSINLLESIFDSNQGSLRYIDEYKNSISFLHDDQHKISNAIFLEKRKITQIIVNKVLENTINLRKIRKEFIIQNLTLNNILPKELFVNSIKSNNLKDDLNSQKFKIVNKLNILDLLKLVLFRKTYSVSWFFGSYLISFKRTIKIYKYAIKFICNVKNNHS